VVDLGKAAGAVMVVLAAFLGALRRALMVALAGMAAGALAIAGLRAGLARSRRAGVAEARRDAIQTAAAAEALVKERIGNVAPVDDVSAAVRRLRARAGDPDRP
jgi:hypothetical protein